MVVMHAAERAATYADVDALIEDVDYRPTTPIEVGIENFVKWYREYYKI